MFGLWAVARHTLRQCLRMKVAGLFIVLLAVALGVLPFLMKGDGTLAGRIRTFLSYGASITSLLLIVVTIFLSGSLVACDIRNKQIFSVATKPIARWQYVVGRWAGVVMLDTVLLVVAGAAIYYLGQFLRAGEALNPTDRRAVETEVFTARERISPELPRITEVVEARKRSLKKQDLYEEALEAYTFGGRLNRRLAEEQLTAELYKQAAKTAQSVAPNRAMVWRFSGIRVEGTETRTTGRVAGFARNVRLMVVEAAPSLIGKLTYRGPVRINGVDGRVERLTPESFAVRFGLEGISLGPVSTLSPGKEVEIVADPTIQITYKATPSTAPPTNTLFSYLEVENPSENLIYREMREDPPEVPVTLTVSARVVDKDGRVVVRYVNLPDPKTTFATSLTVLHEDVGVLYKVGRFDWNFVRGMALILTQLAFVAALGVMAGSFVSFPVACLICFSVLPFQIAGEYLTDAIHPRYAGTGIFGFLSTAVVKVMNGLLPDFGRTSPAEALVDGMNISWSFLGETSFWTLCVQTSVLLLIACLIFRKRELGRVQV